MALDPQRGWLRLMPAATLATRRRTPRRPIRRPPPDGELRDAGAHEQAATLADRLPAAGIFLPFRERRDDWYQFRFGRETDGSPSASWSWEDLD
jgi:hypothetical protein